MNPRRILIIRPSAMGDIVMATPMIAALRRRWPEAVIAWLVEPGLADLLRFNPALDEVIIWPKHEWRELARQRRYPALAGAIAAFRRDLRRRQFDLAIDAVGLAKSRFLLWLSGAQTAIGFDSSEPGAFLLNHKVRKEKNHPAMSSEYRQMVEALGAVPGDFAPQLILPAEADAEARAMLQHSGIRSAYAILVPFTTRPQKHWFDERWVELAGRLQSELQLPAVLLGGPADRAHGEALAAASPKAIVNLAGSTTLTTSAALIRDAALLVGVDTGLTHMGTAFRRPTVALFGATCPYRVTANPATVVLYDPPDCSPCRRKPVCSGRHDCMQRLTVSRVMAAASHLLQQNES